MMQQTEKTKSLVLRIAAVLLCLILISLWMLGDMYARYTTDKDGSDGARVSIFGHDETITADSLLQGLVPGDSRTYTLTVDNGTGDKVSEVSQKYSIEVATAGNLPLTYTLTESDKTIGSFSEKSDAASHTFTDSSMAFSAAEAGTHTYTLTVSWPSGKNSIDLSGLPDYIQVNINVEQVD